MAIQPPAQRRRSIVATLVLLAALILSALSVIGSPPAAASDSVPDFTTTKIRAKTKNISAGDTLTVRYRGLPSDARTLGILVCPRSTQTTSDCAVAHEVDPNGQTSLVTTFVIEPIIDIGGPTVDCSAVANACHLLFLHGPNGGLAHTKKLVFTGAQPTVRVKSRRIEAGETLTARVRHLPTDVDRLGILLCPTSDRPTSSDCLTLHEVAKRETNRRVTTSFVIVSSFERNGEVIDCTAAAKACFLWFLVTDASVDVKVPLRFR